MSSQLATIKPRETAPGQFTPTRGTQVILPDGSVLGGVTRIELVAELNDIWRARIDCIVNVQLMPGMAIDVRNPGRKLGWLRRRLLRLAGVSAVDVTTLDNTIATQWAAINRLGGNAADESAPTESAAEAPAETEERS